MGPDPRSLPWYRPQIEARLKPRVRELFVEYVGLPPDEVESHILAIQDRSFDHHPYPCVGQFQFLHPIITFLPWYQGILERVKRGDSLLDVGCGFAQDLRFLAFDGAPTTNMWGLDTEVGMWRWGLELFRDSGRFEGKFRASDVLDPAIVTHPPMDLMVVNQVFHLFDWETQIKVAKNLVAFTKPGASIVGYQIGSRRGRAAPRVMQKVESHLEEQKDKQPQTAFYHNVQTWSDMWKAVEKESGTRWEVESRLDELKNWGLEPEDSKWMGSEAVGIAFICRKLGAKTNKL